MESPSFAGMRKTRGGASRNPNSAKYFVSMCQERILKDGSTKDWIQVRGDNASLKPLQTFDKSRVLRALLDKHTEVIVKLGDHDEIKHEFEMGKSLSRVKGFVKFICFFECEDDFTMYPRKGQRSSLCKGVGSSMKVIVMPFFSMGPLSNGFISSNHQVFISCIKHAIMSIFEAFFIANICHNDFHVGNVVLKRTSLKVINYSPFPGEAPFEIETHGVRTWIMDFEKSKRVDVASMSARDWFLYDLRKFFMMMPTLVQGIVPSDVRPVTLFLEKIEIQRPITRNIVQQLLETVDGLKFHIDSMEDMDA